MATQKRKTLLNNQHVALPGADLYRGDCLAILPGLAGPFDAVVTDPPYSSGGQSKGDRARSTGDKYLNTGAKNFPDFLGDTKDQRSYLHWSALWMSLCFERLAEGGLMIVFSDWRQPPVTTDAMQAAGVTWRGSSAKTRAKQCQNARALTLSQLNCTTGQRTKGLQAFACKPLSLLVAGVGFEPTTFGL